ncbi:hypothetical protein QN357_17250 [Cryobacterium sp. RTC2.1]|uniref:hypothetical protein n=1 Tax=Cryobacterium sp. RTC2.1 TaxID=3048634 RepID=UPI002B23E316|nr:hypothetical protein [Cryobacterium sp. RTC2.1]MEB0004673.1 hypothetical protein [Cryobacterium sp. RTC2.1]
MNAEELAREVDRLERLRTLLAARNRIEEVSRAVVAAPSDDDAAERVRRLLGCSEIAARHVISTPLRMYRRGDALAREIADLEEYLTGVVPLDPAVSTRALADGTENVTAAHPLAELEAGEPSIPLEDIVRDPGIPLD